jgi:hypothetical protein
LLYNGERFGKALRSPSRDTMLAHASAKLGRGYAFGLHEALDQCGALTGPLLIAASLALGVGYRSAFALLAVPGVAALLVLGRLRIAAPDPALFDPATNVPATYDPDGRPQDGRPQDGRPQDGRPQDGPPQDGQKPRLAERLPARFWLYAAFSAATMLGFSTWAVLAYHLAARQVVPIGWVPVLYALAMGMAGLAAVIFGRLYDRFGLRGLVLLPPLAAAVPFLSFSDSVMAVAAGAAFWGIALGAHESTLRAAVTDLVPAHRRGAGYGNFTAVYGLAWLAGAAVIGLLYGHGPGAVQAFVVVAQVLAVVLLVPLLRTGRARVPV